ncbi:MAG: SGNH/GDSL hydrolase family protein [Lachnospiraceae bacterium]|nr:SGNH/GDSL hydrolase family protein [Lachnospiraceae bacterium]
MGNTDMQNAPKAPKDPTKKRPALYLMFDDVIEGTRREDGKYAEISFLEGRVAAKIRAVMPDVSKEMAQELQTCTGLRKYVHSIGITAMAQKKENIGKTLNFTLSCRREKDYGGTNYQTTVPLDGSEVLILLADYPGSAWDTTLACCRMEFTDYMTAKMTIAFYLNDGYEVPEFIPDPLVDFNSDAYKKMVARSLMQEGNLMRLQRAIKKARAGEDVTIAYIGGSITQGAGAKPIATNSYAYRSYEAFCTRFGRGGNVHFIKAGVGGTPSELGLCRYRAEVLDEAGERGVDIVVIEFAVNDAGDETNGVCFESLALMAANGSGHPAVVLLFSVFMDDGNLQARLAPIGERYAFPMVSLKNAVTPQFYDDQPVITKRQYFYDLYHPSNEGHRIMADCLDYLWQRAGNEIMEGEPANAIPPVQAEDVAAGKEAVYGNTFRELRVYTREEQEDGIAVSTGGFDGTDRELQYVERNTNAFATPEFPKNWMHAGGAAGEPYRITLNCKDLLLVYKDSGDQKFGKAQVFVDGTLTRMIDPLEVGWNHCNAVIVYRSEMAAEHMVEVKMEENSKYFTILGWGYTK